jgi:hypothetical protein
MNGLLQRLAARAVGEVAVASPRLKPLYGGEAMAQVGSARETGVDEVFGIDGDSLTPRASRASSRQPATHPPESDAGRLSADMHPPAPRNTLRSEGAVPIHADELTAPLLRSTSDPSTELPGLAPAPSPARTARTDSLMQVDQPPLADLIAPELTPVPPKKVPISDDGLRNEVSANRMNEARSAQPIAQATSRPPTESPPPRAKPGDVEPRHSDEAKAPISLIAKAAAEPFAAPLRVAEPISSLTDRGIGKLAQAQPVAARQAKVDAAPNTVNVTIGRVEVRAGQAPAPAPSPKRGAPPLTSLDQYLSRRNRGAGA